MHWPWWWQKRVFSGKGRVGLLGTHRLSLPPITQIKNGWGRRVLILRVKCLTEPNRDVESEAETTSSSSASGFAGISSYSWCAGLGGIGFLETSYLTYLKLTNSDAFCPIGGGSCGDILNSDYASVFGVPLPLIGMFAYGLFTILGIQLAGKNLPLEMDENNGRLILLGSTTSMAAASAYFLYILSTKFAGASCSYCLMSALLSFSLLFTTIKDYGMQEIQKMVGLQLCLGGLVVAVLSTSYNMSQYFPISSAEIDLPFFTTEITTESSPLTLALARHLHSVGAKMYGAFWCSHCLEQKQPGHIWNVPTSVLHSNTILKIIVDCECQSESSSGWSIILSTPLPESFQNPLEPFPTHPLIATSFDKVQDGMEHRFLDSTKSDIGNFQDRFQTLCRSVGT
ncbi:NAD(P)H dehydrogenase (quinone) [Actinidia rufa]|uniref:NAD(P)H dehydrogenase (Quinone) n=1 Tax=Actinidia rufa TaxID=165716 RepID=A0A7J0EP75_9ERIC|nr:NAD(P)H dehydrogenase (quinone) [Actinidia rufa]